MISTTSLGRRFGNRLAVDDLSLRVEPGEIVALLGPNGAGKTTTLRMLAGLIAPTTGSAVIDGVKLEARTAQAVRSRVGFLTESPGHWERLTVRANLTTYAGLYGLRDERRPVDRTLALLGLSERADSPVAELSKGMKQKLALARAIVHNPRVLLLDEPTSGLDPQITRLVRELIVGFGREGRTVLISTHNLDEAERVAHRIAVLQQRLVAVDTPDSLRRRLFGRRVHVTLGNDAARFVTAVQALGFRSVAADAHELLVDVDGSAVQTPALVRALVAAGAEIQAVEHEEVPLEDVYLKLIQ